jgi:ectoine hydroxylase-related dioxygenase (phytanoyl-CoA dioxygenase family)
MTAAIDAVTADLVTREALTPDMTPQARRRWLDETVACIRRHGMVVIRNAIPRPAVDAVLHDFKTRYDVYMATGQKKLIRRFQTDPLRAQIPVAIDGPLANPAFFAPPSILALVHEMMGEPLIIGEMGAIISHRGTGYQETHRDSEFLFRGLDVDLDLPPYSLNLLVPLLDVTLDMGPTEYWPGSHRIRDQAVATAQPPFRIPFEAGTVTLHDARMFHRGGPNVSGPVRPAVYINFQRNWYRESSGYVSKPQVRVTPPMVERLPEEYRSLFSWALHLNRTDGLHEFFWRVVGNTRRRVLRLRGG